MQTIGLIVYPGFSAMTFAATSAFDVANLSSGTPIYDIKVVSAAGGMVDGTPGVSMRTGRLADTRYDTLIVGSAVTIPPRLAALEGHLSRAAGTVRRIGSICTGAFVLAEAGLLDGRRSTTHWAAASEMRRRFPKVRVDEDRIFINDGPIWTSAGMSAGMDLALAMVEEDLGPEMARDIAHKLVLYHRRAGGQSQHSVLLDLSPKTDRIQTALDFARRNLHLTLSVEDLAEAARLSPRQFSRAFRSETGQSPAKAIERLRVEAARLMLEQGRHSLEVVARETGFGECQRMRRAFLRAFGHPPS